MQKKYNQVIINSNLWDKTPFSWQCNRKKFKKLARVVKNKISLNYE